MVNKWNQLVEYFYYGYVSSQRFRCSKHTSDMACASNSRNSSLSSGDLIWLTRDYHKRDTVMFYLVLTNQSHLSVFVIEGMPLYCYKPHSPKNDQIMIVTTYYSLTT